MGIYFVIQIPTEEGKSCICWQTTITNIKNILISCRENFTKLQKQPNKMRDNLDLSLVVPF